MKLSLNIRTLYSERITNELCFSHATKSGILTSRSISYKSHDMSFPPISIFTSADSDEPVQPPFNFRHSK